MTLRKRRIAVVIPRYGLVGGGENFVRELTERIAANRHYDVHVFANKWESCSDCITFHKVPVISFPKFLTTISFAWFANRRIAAMNFDIIHTHDRIFRADVFTMHGVPHRFWVEQVRKKRMSLFDYGTVWVEKSLINNGGCRMFLPVSNMAKDTFTREFQMETARIRLVHPGVDVDRFSALGRDTCRDEIRKRFGIGMTDTVLLFVGMNFELKGLDNIIASMAVTKSRCPSGRIKLLVVGKGNIKKYKKLAEKSGLGNDVIFGGVWDNNIERVYMASDIFAMPSGFDTFGIVVLEAMSASLPVIISGTVGAKDFVRDGINGFIVDREDITSISSRLEFMLDGNNRERMAEAAYETAGEHTWDIVVEKVLRIYDEITEG